MRLTCTVGDLQLLLCGAGEIDIADWQMNTQYRNGLTADSQTTIFFWAVICDMSIDERAALLAYATGSPKAPATGFADMVGYNGQQQRFTLSMPGREDDANPPVDLRLPTASTCFNTLYLPTYSTKAVLCERLQFAIRESSGFDEAAIAM